MSAPVRFLAIVVTGWVAIRAATLGALPGFTVSYARQPPIADLPPIVATEFPPIVPFDADQAIGPPSQQLATAFPPQWPVGAGAYYRPRSYARLARPSPQPIPPRPAWHLPSANGGSNPAWEVSGMASLAAQRSRPVPPVAAQAPLEPRRDRLQLTTWAQLRGSPSSGALASGGTLGGSQAGARLTYAFNRWLAASLRMTSPIGGSSGAEMAAGVRLTPLRSVPVAITAERRQSISPHGGGRSAFAVFAEGGLYHRPIAWDFDLDAYFQAGVVGLRSRDLFADGALAVSRPVYGRFSAGFGIWGGIQPGVYRIDAGPRISVRLRKNIYAHADWRQRLVGNARPSSGPALTLAADF